MSALKTILILSNNHTCTSGGVRERAPKWVDGKEFKRVGREEDKNKRERSVVPNRYGKINERTMETKALFGIIRGDRNRIEDQFYRNACLV